MKKLYVFLCIALVLPLALAADKQADIVVPFGEDADITLIPGSLVNLKISEGSTLTFRYQDATNTLEILDIATTKTEAKLGIKGAKAKKVTLKTSEAFGIDLGGADLSEIDITPKLVKNNDDVAKRAVVLEFNNYAYTTQSGKSVNYATGHSVAETAENDPFMGYLLGAIVLLFIILLIVWKRNPKKKEERIEMPSVKEHFNEEDVYVSGTIEKKPIQPQVPVMSILTEEPKDSQIAQTKVAVKGAKVVEEKPKKKAKKKKKTKKKKAKKKAK